LLPMASRFHTAISFSQTGLLLLGLLLLRVTRR